MAGFIVEFDTGPFTRNQEQHTKTWQAARDIVAELLPALSLPAGEYRLKPISKVRWQGPRLAVPFKVGVPQHGLVFLTIKPPRADNDGVFEYGLRGLSNQWDPLAVTEQISQHIKQLESASPPVVEEPPPAPEKLSIADKVALLEQTAARNSVRQGQLAELQVKRAAMQRELAIVQEKLNATELEELKILEEIENDRECIEAQESLAALRKILG